MANSVSMVKEKRVSHFNHSILEGLERRIFKNLNLPSLKIFLGITI
ncbi:hypothetical protein [Caldisericum sp. AR60]